MKRIVSIALIIMMVFSVTACKPTAKEVGIWAVSDIRMDEEAMRQIYEAEGMEYNPSAEEAEEYISYYKLFVGGLYLELNNDGTGKLDFYIPESEKYDGYEEGASASSIRWEDKKIFYTDEGMEDVEPLEYTIENGNIVISEEGVILQFSKINSLNEIENTEFWKSMEELKTQMNQMYDSFDEDSDIVFEEDVVEEVIEETVEDDKND